MKLYPVSEPEMRHFLEADIAYELVMEHCGEMIEEELEAVAADEGYSSFNQWISAMLAKRHPMEACEDASS